jgi:hypothetical protein
MMKLSGLPIRQFTIPTLLAAVTESSAVPACRRRRRLAGALASLQMVLMSRFCKFFQNKTVNCHMQARGASRVKYKLKKELSRWNKFVVQIK